MKDFKFNTIEEALEDLRQGKIILCTGAEYEPLSVDVNLSNT